MTQMTQIPSQSEANAKAQRRKGAKRSYLLATPARFWPPGGQRPMVPTTTPDASACRGCRTHQPALRKRSPRLSLTFILSIDPVTRKAEPTRRWRVAGEGADGDGRWRPEAADISPGPGDQRSPQQPCRAGEQALRLCVLASLRFGRVPLLRPACFATAGCLCVSASLCLCV